MTQGINLENIVDSYCQTPIGYGSRTLKYNYQLPPTKVSGLSV